MKITGPGSVSYNRAKRTAFVTYSTGWDEEAGRYGKVYHTFHDVGSKTEARRLAEEWRQRYNLRADAMTVSDMTGRWLESRNVRNSTLARNRRDAGIMLGYLGDKLACDVTPADIRQMDADLHSRYAVSTVKKVHELAATVLQMAVDEGTLRQNPAKVVKAPTLPKSNREALSEQEASRLLSELLSSEPDGYVAGALVMLATGCRVSEMFALTWDDYDGHTLRIESQITQHDGLHGLKNDGRRRVVSIGGKTSMWLDKWRENAPERRREICTNADGNPPSPSNYRRWWRNWCVSHGFAHWERPDGTVLEYVDGWPVDSDGRKYSRSNPKPRMKYRGLQIHELRHTNATILIANGVDIRTVQARGGWVSPNVPLAIYAHVQDDKEAAAADVFESILAD